MALAIHLERIDDNPERCTYSFGSAERTVGRIVLDKASGDVEVLELNETVEPPGGPFYLAQVVPRLHRYHERDSYPAHDTWDA